MGIALAHPAPPVKSLGVPADVLRTPEMIFPDVREAEILKKDGVTLAALWVYFIEHPFTHHGRRDGELVLRRVSEVPGAFAGCVLALLESGQRHPAEALCKRMMGQ